MNLIYFSLFIIQLFNFVRPLSTPTKDESDYIKLPPCASCRVYVNSFKKGIERTSRGKFEGGDSAWEEENNFLYSKSEVRLTEIQEHLCGDVERGKQQCHIFNEDHEQKIEKWWSQMQHIEPDLFVWLCIKELEVCCPANHFGPKCSPCKGGIDEPCSGNGKCKGEGTRKGNGECDCYKGYEGELCTICSLGYYQSYKDDSKLLCEPCHQSCDGSCSGPGPKACSKCKVGWMMDSEIGGCTDVDECRDSTVCRDNEYCVNTAGSYSCSKCDKACNQCLGPGPDSCIKCSEGYTFDEGLCIDESIGEREQNVIFARYVTYIGLTLAPCIILQRHTITAAIIGLIVAGYISFSEYYLTYMQGNEGKSVF